MDIRKTKTCEKCKTVILLSQVRLFAKNSEQTLVLCEQCSDGLQQAAKKLKTETKPLPTSDFAKYFCSRCQYAFRVDESIIGLTYQLQCPYCGKGDRLERRGSSPQQKRTTSVT